MMLLYIKRKLNSIIGMLKVNTVIYRCSCIASDAKMHGYTW